MQTSTVTADRVEDGEGRMAEPAAPSGAAAEGLRSICSAADGQDFDQLKQLLSTFQADAAGWDLGAWENFRDTGMKMVSLHALKEEVNKAIKNRSPSILQYCMDTVVDAKVIGQKDDTIKMKTAFVEADKALATVSMDQEADEAYKANDELRLTELMKKAKSSDNRKVGYKLAVLQAKCKYNVVLRMRAEREARHNAPLGRIFKPTLQKKDLEELKQREQEGDAAFQKWKAEKDRAKKEKEEKSRLRAERRRRWIEEHEAELREMNEAAFEAWKLQKLDSKFFQRQEEMEQIEFFHLVDVIRKSRDVVRSARNAQRRDLWDSTAKSDLFDSRSSSSELADTPRSPTRSMFSTKSEALASPKSPGNPYRTGRPFQDNNILETYQPAQTDRNDDAQLVDAVGALHHFTF